MVATAAPDDVETAETALQPWCSFHFHQQLHLRWPRQSKRLRLKAAAFRTSASNYTIQCTSNKGGILRTVVGGNQLRPVSK